MYLPYQLQSTEYTRHLDELEAKCERRRAIQETRQARHTIATAAGERLRTALRRRVSPLRNGHEVGARRPMS